jgi:hypothetical protein
MGTNGSNSIFATITSAGGGAGSPCGPGPVQGGTRLGNSGGSGGGGGAYTGASNNGGAGNTPPVNPSQGEDQEQVVKETPVVLLVALES